MTGLPQGWASTKLGDLLSIQSGFAFKSTEYQQSGHFLIRIGNVQDGRITLEKPQYVKLDNKTEQFELHQDDILTSLTGNIGRVARIQQEHLPAALNQRVARLIPEGALQFDGYLYAFLSSSHFRGELSAHGQGGAQQNVSPAIIGNLEIPLPPLPEQRRIVRKLDTLSARSTTARTHLTAIEKLVERYKWLVIGQLCLGGVASQFQDQAELPELPQGWEWSRAEDLCHWITKGTTPSKDELFAGKGDVPFIKVYNLTFSERLDFSVDPTFVSIDTHNIALKRSKLFPGDVLINIVGPPLGKTAIVPDDFSEWNMNQAIAVFRPKERLFNRFLLHWLSSEWFLSWALSRSKATAGQRNLTLEICRDTPVPLPSFDEQLEIVRRIETAFAKIDRLAAEAAKALKLLGHLDQRILAKAFAGDLVPQDPTDEPADTLLARVREARATAPKGKRRRAVASE